MAPLTRRRFLTLAGGIVAGAAAAPLFRSALTGVGRAGAATGIEWRSVAIGGGGFVPGIVFNEGARDVIYARTDIGGLYRWEPADEAWVPLLDWVGFDNWGYLGVASVATDPVDADRVYAAVGMYTNDWDPNPGAVLRSTDRGASWSVTPLPVKLGGNMPGRGMGERLAIDPNNNAGLYLAAPTGHGLWRSTDFGASWAQVTAFPNPGNYVQDPTDTSGLLSDNQGVVWVAFDKSTGSPGSTTQHIYVGVADKNNTVYGSTDGGATWSPIAGQPTGYLAHKGVVDHVGGRLYIATSDTGGPYDGAKGDVWRYDIAAGAWTQISPIPSSSSDDYFGYSGLTIDRQHPDTLMVATQISWWPDVIIFRSTDAGATWTRIWDWNGYPGRTYRYTQDITAVPWLTFGTNPSPPEVTPKLGWMTEAMAIDPFDSDRMLYGTGATIYGTTNLTAWDAGGQIAIKPVVAGLEETACLDLISPPTGAHLLTALGDVGGFVHSDLTKIPSLMYTQPNLTSTRSIDYAEISPSTIVRSGDSTTAGVTHAGFSTDGGSTWWQASSEPSGITGGGTIAVAANASAVVWAPAGAAVSVSTDYGSTWRACSGIPSGAFVRSDRVNPKTFYGLSAGTLYVSTDGGATFVAAATGLPSTGAFKPVPGVAGELWIAGNTGLYRSRDAGATFTKVATVDSAQNVGFGMPAAGAAYPAIYLIGSVGGVHGVYRSDDTAASWVRVNDDAHRYGNIGAAITGDPRLYGRVYLATNGRGVLYADTAGISGGGDTTRPSAPTNVTVTATTASSVSLSWSASTDNVGVTGYLVFRNGVEVGVPPSTSFTDTTGLTANTSYLYAVKAKDAAGNVSDPSAAVTATTQAGQTGDTTPPSAPELLGVTATTTTSVSLVWDDSTDNVGVANYLVFRDGVQVGTPKTRTYTDTGLSANTSYSYTVNAVDAAGNQSDSSAAVSATTQTGQTGGGCSATYHIDSDWGTGFVTTVTVSNTGTTPTRGWSVTWTFNGNQHIDSMWNTNPNQSGQQVTATNQDYNAVIQPGQSTTFGFQASYSGPNLAPTLSCTTS